MSEHVSEVYDDDLNGHFVALDGTELLGPSETIADELGWGYNPVLHTKTPHAVVDPMCTVTGTYNGPRLPNGDPEYGPESLVQTCKAHRVISISKMPDNPAEPQDLPWGDLVAQLGQTVEGVMQSKTNILENIATFGQTLKMVKQPLEGLRKILSSAKRGKLSFSQVMQGSASTWLEYRYGWNPLKYTFQALSEVWKRAEDHRRFLLDSRGKWISSSVSKTYSHKYPSTIESNGWNTRDVARSANIQTGIEYLSNVTTIRVGCKNFIRSDIVLQSQMQFIMQYLHANSLFDVLWELMPYSFVIDWLINVDMLQAVSSWSRLSRPDVQQIGYSIKRVFTFSGSWLAMRPFMNGYYAFYDWEYDPGYGVGNPVHWIEYNRGSGFPPNSVIGSFFGSGIGVIHGIDAASLFIKLHQ